MSLLDSMMEKCKFLNKSRTPDGEGGFNTSWVEGAEFDAAITIDTSMTALVAEQQGVSSVYTVTTHGDLLDYHDSFKRVSDGKIFRVTSDSKDKKSPTISTLNISQVTAEKWELPS